MNWNEIANQAGQSTDDYFKSQMSSLTRLNDQEIEDIINETGISKQDLANVLKEVKDATKSNANKANAIRNISKGIDVLVGLAGKLI
ncbi:hypothetical protein RCC89_19280 [Cytophagaceae bacterium ABcell3]|nr:hypothetical protein RCC89_19280 [Cytophagaceae bacterium ABcell3]